MIDALGHPLNVGTKVLTTPHCSTEMTYVTKIVKTTKNAVYVYVNAYRWCEAKGNHVEYQRLIRRQPRQFIAIGVQVEYNQENYPENAL